MAELTPEEQQFFESGGELPEALAAEHQEQQNTDDAAQAAIEAAEATAAAEVAAKAAQQPAQTAQPDDATETLRRTLAEEQSRRVKAETRFEEIERQLKEKTAPTEEQAPDPDVDPIGAVLHQINKLNEKFLNLQETQTKAAEQNELKSQVEQFTNNVRQIKDEFVKTTPDFDDAYKHIREVRAADLRSLGVSEDRIPHVLLQDEFQLAQAAIQQGKNPAAEMYAMSKRYGYQPKAAPATPKGGLTPEEKVAAVQKGQQSAKTAQRASATTELTSEALKDAGDDDLNKLVKDDAAWNRLVGHRSNDIF